ncbi:ATP-dependent RNA helicase HrpA [Ruicaihuangia caeni]|uniref:ATP-dependent RNA helicase HrpA n=1 Tax=Ruicaihuangia caeni TaxID=3042517 RepID=A0AAW6T6V8_9MICO|nr:ATP-dependent RNA helicase HrpA [Klugiella sp. YN-L-19]MDI2099561.1 ATP-dependent RNA helicase HrpA [Klugiella sp. YN-L-19]
MSAPLLAISYPAELPVSQRRDDIAKAIADHQVVIVAGATGSGKTTQLPKICLELGRTMIGHTQPRRIAARTIAERVAEELGSELGDLVGYQVRFTDQVSAKTRIKLMTDGILLNEIHRDRLLKRYDTIIIDEAHERSLTIDFLLGYLKRILPKRPDLKVIITSATIDPESFAKHFADAEGRPAPIVEVSGRTYPVEIRYRPLDPDAVDTDDSDDVDDAFADGPSEPERTKRRNPSPSVAREPIDLMDGIIAGLEELGREEPGDVLVFLSGENEIRDAEDAIRGAIQPRSPLDGTEVLPLYGRLSAADQHRVFEPGRAPGIRRRVVLATNVAETSLTVPGIKYVIDAGTARISRYSPRSKVQRLPIEPISQASANQRSGRSGRTSDGIAIRLYSEADYERRPEFTEPEILRTNLAAVILQMIALGLGEIERFPFLQPPDSRGIKDGLDLLRELGAIDRDGAITRVGRQLTQLAIDPRFARMVIESGRQGHTREVIAIVAALSIQDPRERPLEKRPQADQLHARFTDPTSDFITLLNLWNYLKEQERMLSGSALRRLCRAEFINFLRFREWEDVVRQLTRAAKQLGLHVESEKKGGGADAAVAAVAAAVADAPTRAPVAADAIHRSLLAGLLSHIGLRDAQKKDYVGARNHRFLIFPGSGLAKKQPQAVMAAELVETSRLFARTVAAIEPAWAEQLAGDLVKRTYSEPHWEKKQGAAVAWERATLYGVPIVPRRRAQYARVDPEHARELFIRHGLVEGDWDVSRLNRKLFEFDRKNRALRARLEQLEERTRRRDILFDDEAVFEFYDRRIPADVATVRGFEKWWRGASREQPSLLTMTEDDLAADTAVDSQAYPTSWTQGDQKLGIGYRFEPGADDDGVTVKVPLPLLSRVKPQGFDWLVPGLREELVTALLKTLPKAIRRNVVPASDWARRLLEAVPAGADLSDAGITEFLAREIQRQTFTPVSPDDFDLDRLPPHLRPGFAVTDDRGRVLARSKSLESLQQKLKSRARDSVAAVTERAVPNSIEREGITAWDFGELPKAVDTRSGGGVIRAYPALTDRGGSVSITLLTTPEDQARELPRGIRRLLALTIPSPLGYVRDHLSQHEKLTLATSPYQNVQALLDDCLDACLDQALRARHPNRMLFTAEEFEALRREASAGLVDQLYAAVSLTARTLAAHREAEKALKSATNMSVLPAVADAREQLAALIFRGFVSRTGLAQLRHLPRYLQAVVSRLEKLATDIARDRGWMNEVAAATAAYTRAGGTLPLGPDAAPHLVHVRWLLEELRVSLFAQQLGTAEPVSLQRIQKALK